MQFPTYKKERELLTSGYSFVAGCDEVGVGPIAGPVVAAACIIDPKCVGEYRSKSKWYYRVRDSKTISEKEREELVSEVLSHCLVFGVGEVSPETIDQVNIHNASLLAMKLAVEEMLEKLNTGGEGCLLVDGRFKIQNLKPNIFQQAIVDGDAQVLTISAASIIAKVHRDNILKEYDRQFPEYGFAKHKGYNTKEHQKALAEKGITAVHRKSFLKRVL